MSWAGNSDTKVNQFIHFSTLNSNVFPEPHDVGKGMLNPSQGTTNLSDNLERRSETEFWLTSLAL
jgi:hypothetical protein